MFRSSSSIFPLASCRHSPSSPLTHRISPAVVNHLSFLSASVSCVPISSAHFPTCDTLFREVSVAGVRAVGRVEFVGVLSSVVCMCRDAMQCSHSPTFGSRITFTPRFLSPRAARAGRRASVGYAGCLMRNRESQEQGLGGETKKQRHYATLRIRNGVVL